MTERIPLDQVHFVHGRPHFDFDECYTCFDDRQLLFRLVNTARRQWAFYNDTTDTVVKVRAVFAPGSVITALQHTTLRPLHAQTRDTAAAAAATVAPPSTTTTTTAAAIGVAADATQPPQATTTSAHDVPAGEEAAGAQEATLEVEPGYTELFIEGTVTGFSMDFKTEAAPATDVQFVYRRPTEPYDKIYKCFKNNGNGLLFRLVSHERKQWLFYNDTREYVMKVTVEFANRDEVKPLGKTTSDEAVSRTRPDAVVYVLLIEPGKTEPFIEGTPEDYTLRFSAEPVNNTAPLAPDEVEYINGAPDPAIVPDLSTCKIYKCFKNNGNGLLFRIVDEANKQWSFYNDTTEYVMTATVHLPTGQVFTPCEGAVVRPDPEEEGTTIVTMDIPPVTTCSFLRGLPRSFSVSFAADSANKSQPEAAPQYENGKPDSTTIEFDEVYKCFKDRGNGLLFRLVDTKHSRWGFYNDTTNLNFTVRVAFENAEAVQPLGNTREEDDADMGGRVLVCEIAPQTTEAFAAGDMGGYSIKFAAVKS